MLSLYVSENGQCGQIFNPIGIRKVADGVYHAGQGRSFTMFVDVGNYFIASGGERGLRKNLAAVNKFAGHDKPLKFFIASHHHSEHIRILTEVIELGASIVTVEAHLKTIKQSIDSAVTDERFILVNNRMSLGDGKLEVIDIATAHSEHYLLVYMPKDNLAFTEDLIETQLKLGLPRVHHDMVTFRQKVESLNLGVEKFLDGHSLRMLTMQELREATDRFTPVSCPTGYRICEKG